MANATDIQVRCWIAGGNKGNWQPLNQYLVSPVAGVKNTSNYITCFQFTTTAYASSVTLHFAGNGTMGSDAVLRYAIRDAETDAYDKATAATDADGTVTVSNNLNDRMTSLTVQKGLAAGTHYLYLWTNKAANVNNYVGFYFRTTTYPFSIDYEEIATYTLTKTQGANSTLTVTRTSSPIGSTGALNSGATIYDGDKLTVTFSASTGYDVTCKVGSASVNSGYVHTVSGNITIATTATKKKFPVTIAQATGSTLTVKNGSTAISNGASVEYGTVLTITYGAETGYDVSCKVGNTSISSGATHTVTEAVTIATTATLKTYKLTITQAAGSTLTVKKGNTVLSNGATITHNDVLTVIFTASEGYNVTCALNGSFINSGATHTVSGAVTVATTAALKTYTLTIQETEHCSITVKRTASQGGSTGALANGATLYHFDALSISVTPDAGYKLDSRSPAGDVASVTGDVTVVVAVSPLALAHILDGGVWGDYLIHILDGDAYAGYGAYIWNNGAWEPYA